MTPDQYARIRELLEGLRIGMDGSSEEELTELADLVEQLLKETAGLLLLVYQERRTP